MRNLLINAYLDFRNNYLSIEIYSEHNGLTYEQGKELLAIAREVYYSEHPDA